MPSPIQFRSFLRMLGAIVFICLIGIVPAASTISTTTASTTAQGNNATTAFNYGFIISSPSYAVVTIIDTNVTPNTIVTLGPTQYTITGIGNPAGGTVTYPLSGAPLAPGVYITISRVVPLIQTTSISNQGPTFRAIENALDYLTEITQQLQAQINVLQAEAAGGTTPPVPTGGRVITAGIIDTASTTDLTILWDSPSTGNKTETLYSCNSSTAWKTLIITDQYGSFGTYPLSIVGNGSDTVGGLSSYLMPFNNQSSYLQCDGAGHWLPQ